MNYRIRKTGLIVFVLLAAPQAYAWEMFGYLAFIGNIQVRAITRVEDPDHDSKIMMTDAQIFEEGTLTGEDADICVYKTICVSRTKVFSVSSACEYRGRGSAVESFGPLIGVPIPWTLKEWGGGGAGEIPLCARSGRGGVGPRR
jgi:hypothetical protein